MTIETPDDAVEGVILENVSDLHEAMYDRMSTISGIDGLRFMGFDSGRTRDPLPQVGMHISMESMDIDRSRPAPMDAHRLEENSGEEINQSYDGEVFTGYEARTLRYPTPIVIVYKIDTWCHSAQTQLALLQAIFQTFPDRGSLTLQIDGSDFQFPIELLGVENLDDLAENIRERIFRFRVEAWIESYKPDQERGIITSSEIQVEEGNSPEDHQEWEEPWVSIVDEPDEE